MHASNTLFLGTMNSQFDGSKLPRLYNNSSFNKRYSLKVLLCFVIFILVLVAIDICKMEKFGPLFLFYSYAIILSVSLPRKVIIVSNLV